MERIIKDNMKKLPEILEEVKDHEEASEGLAVRFLLASLFFVQAPITIAVCVREMDYPILQYLIKDGMDSYEARRHLGFIEIQSVAAAIQNLLLAAHGLGYEGCWMNVPFFAKDDLETLLGVEKPWSLLALVPIGKPDHSPPTPTRKSIEEISHFID